MGKRVATEEKRRRVLEHGMELLHRNGYHATSVDDLTGVAAIPKGSFYNYFDGKESFACDAVRAFAEQSLRRFTEQSGPTARSRLLAVFTGMATEQSQNFHFSRGCPLGNLSLELADSSESVRNAIVRSFEQIHHEISRLIREARSSGEIGSDFSDEELADLILDSWEGALLRMKVEKNGAPLERFLKLLATQLLPLSVPDQNN